MTHRTLFAAGHILPDAQIAIRNSAFASAPTGTRGVWILGFEDGASGINDRRIISELWRSVYDAGRNAGAAAVRVPDAVTDVE